MRIDVVVNTTAQRHSTRPALLDRMRRLCAGAASIHATSTLAELHEVARGIAERGSDLVILSGGDGSFMAGVTALARALGEDNLPRFGLLPGGTVATVARNWGMRGDPVTLLRRMLASRGELRSIRRPTLRVAGTLGGVVDERLGFMFGTGLVARFFDVYYAAGGGGYAAAAKIVARIFAESFWGGAYARRVLDPLPCWIDVEGRALGPDAWSLVCAAVVRDLGIHMLVTYRAGEDLARPHLVASALGPSALGPRAPLVLAGKSIGGRDHFDDLVRDFVVRFAENTLVNGQRRPAPGPYVLDGDVLRADSVRVSAGPAIEVVTLDP